MLLSSSSQSEEDGKPTPPPPILQEVRRLSGGVEELYSASSPKGPGRALSFSSLCEDRTSWVALDEPFHVFGP